MSHDLLAVDQDSRKQDLPIILAARCTKMGSAAHWVLDSSRDLLLMPGRNGRNGRNRRSGQNEQEEWV